MAYDLILSSVESSLAVSAGAAFFAVSLANNEGLFNDLRLVGNERGFPPKQWTVKNNSVKIIGPLNFFIGELFTRIDAKI
jgi:hypothetical protein